MQSFILCLLPQRVDRAVEEGHRRDQVPRFKHWADAGGVRHEGSSRGLRRTGSSRHIGALY